jgi:hypothetical protein
MGGGRVKNNKDSDHLLFSRGKGAKGKNERFSFKQQIDIVTTRVT